MDLRMPLPLGELVVFIDSAYGEGRNELTPTWGHLTNVGMGWDADLLPNLVSRLSWAVPVTAKGSANLDDDGPQLYWQLQYAY
jgi:hemolysin activation/secretion protein